MPSATPMPHQDPVTRPPGTIGVTLLEHVTTLLAAMDRRFESQRQDLVDTMNMRLDQVDRRFMDSDLRYQQRFDAQTKALDAALAAQKEAVHTAMIAAEKATSKAEVAADKRFESVNEFRAQLTDQTATFMPRTEAEQRMQALAEKISDMKTTMDVSSGQAVGSHMDQRLTELSTLVSAQSNRLATTGGKTAGLQAGWVYLLGALGAVGTLVSIILVINGG